MEHNTHLISFDAFRLSIIKDWSISEAIQNGDNTFEIEQYIVTLYKAECNIHEAISEIKQEFDLL